MSWPLGSGFSPKNINKPQSEAAPEGKEVSTVSDTGNNETKKHPKHRPEGFYKKD